MSEYYTEKEEKRIVKEKEELVVFNRNINLLKYKFLKHNEKSEKETEKVISQFAKIYFENGTVDVSSILKYPTELRSIAINVFKLDKAKRFESLSNFRKKVFEYIDSNSEKENFSKYSLTTELLELSKKFSFNEDDIRLIKERIGVFWNNFEIINKYKKKSKDEVIRDFTWEYDDSFNKLDLDKIKIEYTPLCNII